MPSTELKKLRGGESTKTKTPKILIIGALIATTLAVMVSPAFACRLNYTAVSISTGDLASETFPFPVTFDAEANGFNQIVWGVGNLHDPMACGESQMQLTGTVKGDTVTLHGWIVETEYVQELVGTKVTIEAKGGEISITLDFRHVKGWELSGMTFVFAGEATVSIT